MISPVDLELPEHFTEFRSGQFDAALRIAESDKRFYLLSAPTGTGKSLIYNTVAKLTSARTLVLTGTKGLQAQLMRDFEPAGMADIKGQSNYRCVALDRKLAHYGRPGSGCDEGPCKVGVYCSLKDEGGCLYYDAQAAARNADLVVTNYAYWMVLGRYSDPLSIGKFDLLVLDEAHTASDWLSNFCAVEVSKAESEQLLGLPLPSIQAGSIVWSEWALQAIQRATAKIAEYKERLSNTRNGYGIDKATVVEVLLRLGELARDLEGVAKSGQRKSSESPRKDARMPGLRDDWVAEETGHGIRFCPVWAHSYAEPLLFRSIPKILLVSATLSQDTAPYLGIPADEMDYSELPSTFDPRRRPMIYIPTTRVDRNMVEGQVRVWVNRIDRIIEGRLDRKGIIHTRSYKRAEDLLRRSKYAHVMVTHDTRTARSVIEQFKRAKPPCVLVSPSVEEGHDFPGDQCSYQVIAKIPFADTRGPLMKARAKSDKKYLSHLAAQSVIQMVGRGMRSKHDFSENFVIDDHWSWFRKAVRFPKWFTVAWRQEAGVPPAPPLDK